MKLEIKNVSKQFKDITVLNNVNLTLEGGHIYGLIGRNGSGKSVFLKMICGFYEPTTGEIILEGENYIQRKTFPKNLRALIEKPNFLPDFTGYENLALLASIQEKVGKKEILKTLEIVHLKEVANIKYRNYSLGMKQKLGLAQVFMENPRILILDEPFNGIEKETADQLREYLKGLREKGRMIIIASHMKEDIKNLADTIFSFDGGNIKKTNK